MPPSPPPRRRLSGLAQYAAAEARKSCSVSSSCSRSHADEIAAMIPSEHGKVHDDAQGEFARGIEVVDFACGIPELLKGEYTQQRRRGDRQLVGAPAARRGRRHHALQFPGHGADVDVPDGDRLRQHLRAEAVGARPVASMLASCSGGGPAGWRLQRRARRQASGRRAARSSRHAGGELRRLDADRRIHLPRGTAAGKRVQALGGAKNHMVVMPDADIDKAVDALIGAATVRAASAAWRSRWRWPSATRPPTSWSGARAEHRGAEGRRGDRPSRHGPGGHGGSASSDQRLIEPGRRGRRRTRRRRPRARVQGDEGGFFLGGSLFDHVTPEMSIYKEEIFGPVLCVVRAPESEERSISSTPRVRQRHGHLHA